MARMELDWVLSWFLECDATRIGQERWTCVYELASGLAWFGG